MRILVTGANGYMGRGIVKELTNMGQDVIATDFKLDGVEGSVEKIAGDIFEIEDPYEYYGKPAVVLHLAWRNGFVHNDMSHLNDLPKHYTFLEKMAWGGRTNCCSRNYA